MLRRSGVRVFTMRDVDKVRRIECRVTVLHRCTDRPADLASMVCELWSDMPRCSGSRRAARHRQGDRNGR